LFSTLRRVRSCTLQGCRLRADDTTDDLSSGDDEDNDVTVQLLVIVI